MGGQLAASLLCHVLVSFLFVFPLFGGKWQQAEAGLFLHGVNTASHSPSFAMFPFLGAAPCAKVPHSRNFGFISQ